MSERALRKWDYIYYAMIAGTFLFFGMAILGYVGERLGWWNDVGEILMQAGTVGGVLLGGVTLVVGASRTQVASTKEAVLSTKDAVHSTKDAVHSTKDAVDATREAVEANGEKLDSVDDELSHQTVVLEQIRDQD